MLCSNFLSAALNWCVSVVTVASVCCRLKALKSSRVDVFISVLLVFYPDRKRENQNLFKPRTS